MLPASNRGPGQSLGFPDTCLTPAAPSPVPVPYPNIAMNAQAAPFAASVKVNMMNALNLVSSIPMTSGDEAGSAHPLVKQAQRYTLGSFNVFIEGMPGIHLGSLTTHNNMNCPVGAVIVPSAPNVTYSKRSEDPELRSTRVVSEAAVQALAQDVEALHFERSTRVDGTLVLSFGVLSRGISQAVAAAVRSAATKHVELDLRGAPGGALDEVTQVLSLFTPRNAALFSIVESDGDERAFTSEGGPFEDVELTVRVDAGTASAAEVLAGALQKLGRARLVGERTFGKGVLHELARAADGSLVLVLVGEVRFSDGAVLDGAGLTP